MFSFNVFFPSLSLFILFGIVFFVWRTGWSLLQVKPVLFLEFHCSTSSETQDGRMIVAGCHQDFPISIAAGLMSLSESAKKTAQLEDSHFFAGHFGTNPTSPHLPPAYHESRGVLRQAPSVQEAGGGGLPQRGDGSGGGGRWAKVEVWSWKKRGGLRWGKPPEMRVMIY